MNKGLCENYVLFCPEAEKSLNPPSISLQQLGEPNNRDGIVLGIKGVVSKAKSIVSWLKKLHNIKSMDKCINVTNVTSINSQAKQLHNISLFIKHMLYSTAGLRNQQDITPFYSYPTQRNHFKAKRCKI